MHGGISKALRRCLDLSQVWWAAVCWHALAALAVLMACRRCEAFLIWRNNGDDGATASTEGAERQGLEQGRNHVDAPCHQHDGQGPCGQATCEAKEEHDVVSKAIERDRASLAMWCP